jgi:hypothetical protein
MSLGRFKAGIANAYASEGKYHESESLDKPALEIERHVLGPENPEP